MSGTVPTYDDNGNLTSYGARSYTYSAENQLLEATTLSGGTVQYSYGPGARRVRKNVDGTVTSFIHAGGMEIAEYDGSGNILRRYIPGPGVDQRIAMIECGTSANCTANEANTDTQYYFADRLGNVLAVTDNTGDIVQQFFYTPFGVEMVGNASGNPFRYTGRKYDPETGLYYYRARYYDADLGRFLQVDPIGYEDQWNLYSYVGNNPLNATDPSGRQSVGCENCTAQLERDGLSPEQISVVQAMHAGELTSEGMHTTLDAGGLAPGVGLGPDLVNAALYAIEGDGANAMVSLAAAVPVAGQFVAGARLTSRAGDALQVSRNGPDFVVTPNGTAVPTSQSQMREGFTNAGFVGRTTLDVNLKPNGMGHVMPNGMDVRTMDPSGSAGRRASFQNRNGGAVDPDGNPVQPPRGLTGGQRRQHVRERTHVEQQQ